MEVLMSGKVASKATSKNLAWQEKEFHLTPMINLSILKLFDDLDVTFKK